MRKLWGALGEGRVRSARLRALAWATVGVISFPLGWASSVVLVWIASVYANVVGELGVASAEDDEAVLKEVRALREQVAKLTDTIERLSENQLR